MTRRSLGPRHPARSHAQRDLGDLATPASGGPAPAIEDRSCEPVGGFQPGEGWPAPPRGGVPSPTALDPSRGRPRARP